MNRNISYRTQEEILRGYANFYAPDSLQRIRTEILATPIHLQNWPSYVKEILRREIGKPPKENYSSPGFIEFYDYIRLLEERYSIYPNTMLSPKQTNRYYVDNILALDEKILWKNLKRKKVEQLQMHEIFELFENEGLPRNALHRCFGEELIIIGEERSQSARQFVKEAEDEKSENGAEYFTAEELEAQFGDQ